MLFNRQKLLLALLDAFGGRMGKLDFQKLLFLYCQEWEAEPSYEFVPYRFGAFSFTSYADKRKLTEKGLLESEDAWALTEQGREAIRFPVALRRRPERFADQHAELRGDALVRQIYRRFPATAVSSEIAESLLADDTGALARIQAQRPQPKPAGLCTIGYEGKSLEAYLNDLLAAGVNLLCDVRRNPLSRKYGFSKRALASACDKLGIRYEHIPELGIASSERKELKDQSDYDSLFAHYERESLPQQTSSLRIIRNWIEEGYRIALTCYELEPHQCHRHCVAEALEREYGEVCKPQHL